MEALTNALSSPAFANIGKIASLGSTGYNLYNQWQQQQYQNQLRSLAINPAKMNAFAQKFIQPLNAGLTAGVGNQAQAYLGERGLSESPQISEQVIAQAIAPYLQQNQQAGYADALQALGLGGGAIPPGEQQSSGLDAITKGLAGLAPLGNAYGNVPSPNLSPGVLPSFNPTPEPPPIDLSSWFASQSTPDLSAFVTGG